MPKINLPQSLIWAVKKSFATVVSLTLLVTSSQADNGDVAYAYPIKNITIDGDLSDWPQDIPRYAIDRQFYGHGDKASFRVAYDMTMQSLYVAVEVVDTTPVVGEGGPQNWQSQDSHLLYIDPTHSQNGSGPWLFSGTAQGSAIQPQEGDWDPVAAQMRIEDTELKTTHQDGKIIYEWRIALGDLLQPGTSLGLDVLVWDLDKTENGQISTGTMWGKYTGKSQRSGRLGDVILMDPVIGVGRLQGQIRWAEGIEGPDLKNYLVRIQSTENPKLWVQPETDEAGRYDIVLPAGNYRVTSPFSLYSKESYQFEYRLEDGLEVRAQVEPNKTTLATDFEWQTVASPDLFEGKGILLDFQPSNVTKLDHFIEAYMHHYEIPGVSFALVKDAKLVYAKNFGVKNTYTQAPVTDSTLFDVGSITKIAFAFAVHRLAERGDLDLDRPLHEYLAFDAVAHDDRSYLITARYVLSHQTGFPNWASFNNDGQFDIKFTPGTSFGYSGEGFEYLRRVVEKLTGKNVEQIMLEETQNPMGFNDATRFTKGGDWQETFANGHDVGRTYRPMLIDQARAAYGMKTKAKSLSAFMISLMSRKGLSAEGYDQMFTPQVTTDWDSPNGEDWPVKYGLGFEVTETPYGRVIAHGGSNQGNLSRFEYYEDQKTGFIILTNSESGNKFIDALRKYLIAGASTYRDTP